MAHRTVTFRIIRVSRAEDFRLRLVTREAEEAAVGPFRSVSLRSRIATSPGEPTELDKFKLNAANR